MLLTFIFKRRIRENRLIKAKTHKRCTGCKAVKPLDKFDKNRKRNDGTYQRKTRCKDCKKTHDKARRATPAGKAAIKEANARCVADPVRHAAHLKTSREYNARKYATPEGLVENRCRSRIRHAMHDSKSTWGPLDEDQPRGAAGSPDSTIHLLGLAVLGWGFYAKYLADRLYRDMAWPNFEIDHIRPLCSFNLSDPEERTKAFHYTNTQLLTSEDNVKKSDKWTEEGHHLRWDGVKWVLKADWELIDEDDKYGLNKYQRKVEPAAEPPAKRRKIGIEAYFKAK